MKHRLDDRVALVTGGGSGMGRAACLLLAQAGARVVVADKDLDAARQTVALIAAAGQADGAQADAVQTDVSVESEVAAMVAFAVERFGRLDCAFNNAGVPANDKSIETYSLNAFNRTVSVNLTGVFLCMKYEITQMRRQGGPAAIVNNASAWGTGGWAGAAPYVASKAGVIGLTKSAALDLAGVGIRVNAVCPGLIATPMSKGLVEDPEGSVLALGKQPMGRFGRPEEVAEAVLWLCSDASSFVTGTAMMVDGGWVI